MTWVFMNSPATANDRVVLLTIADEADDEGLNARPSIRRIARKSRAHAATAARSISRLEAGGELLVLRPERRGRGRFNRYAVTMGRDPLQLAEALGWPPPALTELPEEWRLDGTDAQPASDEADEEMVADCDLSIPRPGEEEEHGKVADCDLLSEDKSLRKSQNGRTGARQNDEKRPEKVALVRADPKIPGSIDPRVAAPVANANPPPTPATQDTVPSSLSTGLGRKPARHTDPLDGIADATAAIAERHADRLAGEADLPRTPPPPAWRDDMRRRLYRDSTEGAAQGADA